MKLMMMMKRLVVMCGERLMKMNGDVNDVNDDGDIDDEDDGLVSDDDVNE